MKKYIILTIAILALPLDAQAQMDHSMHSMNEGQGEMEKEAEKFVDSKEKKFPADYHDVETNPKVGQPIKKVVEDGWNPKFYHYEDIIQSDHVAARFYGTCLAKMLMGG